jgi:metal-sulfur cluster biosynthetic enzyme
MATEEEVYDALRDCYDPEIPTNIVDLGLVYSVKVAEDCVAVNMTLTAPGCGMGSMIAADAERRILEIPGVKSAKVELVWDPPWSPTMMSAEARKQLGVD